ncbi:hypothetical protein IID24_02770 [Patescibacteria group bacterium]|nr:hypothetical protein [Patescibacteria group bacterium]
MNNFERQLLAAGLTITKSYQNKFERIKRKLSKEERLVWFHERSKRFGYKVFNDKDIMKFAGIKSRYKLRKIIRKLVDKGHLR